MPYLHLVVEIGLSSLNIVDRHIPVVSRDSIQIGRMVFLENLACRQSNCNLKSSKYETNDSATEAMPPSHNGQEEAID